MPAPSPRYEDISAIIDEALNVVVRMNDSNQLHSSTHPSKEWPDGHKEWYMNGMVHRSDGPAVIFPNGDAWWYYYGVHYASFEQYVIAAEWTDEQIIEWKLTHD